MYGIEIANLIWKNGKIELKKVIRLRMSQIKENSRYRNVAREVDGQNKDFFNWEGFMHQDSLEWCMDRDAWKTFGVYHLA